MAIFALTYDYTDDSAARDTHRAAHREFLVALAEQDKVLAAGAFRDDQDPGALILLRAADADEAAALVADDPFQTEGLVSRATVRAWSAGLGSKAEHLA